MKEVKETKILVLKGVALLNIVLILLMLIFFDLRSAYGIFIGSLIGVINFHLLSLSLQKAVKLEPTKAGFYAFIQYIIRYILWFLVFYIALKRPDVNILTTIVGMLSVKVVILVINVFNLYPLKRKFSRKEVS
ncbi:ATP synthase subunit I [Halonatronum saccharophilum]|uniref:ATP synthase subunit I n=1 Tax=Halonatronum saccharophilum TaxID=150060 RepID=UPI00048799F3|nr:ATP synthase subunit I [Halonatronum saccharophilum]